MPWEHRGGIDERWFATTPAANEGAPPDEDSAMSFITARERSRSVKRSNARAPSSSAPQSGRLPPLAGLQQILRQSRSHSPPCTKQCPGGAGGTAGKTGILLLPAATECLQQQLSVAVFRPRTRHRKGTTSSAAETLERGRQRHLELQQSLPLAAWHGLAGAAVHPALARLPRHL